MKGTKTKRCRTLELASTRKLLLPWDGWKEEAGRAPQNQTTMTQWGGSRRTNTVPSVTSPYSSHPSPLVSPHGWTQPGASWVTEQVKKAEDAIWRDEWGIFRTPIISLSQAQCVSHLRRVSNDHSTNHQETKNLRPLPPPFFPQDLFFRWIIFFKSLYWICYNIVFVLCFGFLAAARHVGSLQAGIKTMSLALEGEVLTTGQPGKSPRPFPFKNMAWAGVKFYLNFCYHEVLTYIIFTLGINFSP